MSGIGNVDRRQWAKPLSSQTRLEGMSNIQKPGKTIQNYLDNTQPESTFSIFRKTVTHLKNILRSIMRAIYESNQKI